MLKSDRLNIRELNLTDLNNIHQLHSLPETDKFNTLGIPDSIDVTKALLEEWIRSTGTTRDSFVFGIELKDSREFIGLIALNLGKPKYKSGEVWFKIHKNFWNRGYTTEALKRLLVFGFDDLKLHRIEAGCAVENIASSRVLEKSGMKREGMSRKILPIRGEWKDNYFYAILEDDFPG